MICKFNHLIEIMEHRNDGQLSFAIKLPQQRQEFGLMTKIVRLMRSFPQPQ